MTWSGEFDVPCRFDTDLAQIEKREWSDADWEGIQIVELKWGGA